MFSAAPLPQVTEITAWDWSHIQPYYDELAARTFDVATVESWLTDWSQLASLLNEWKTRLYIATTQNTADTDAQALYARYVESIEPHTAAADQTLRAKLLASGLAPPGMEIILRNMRADVRLYHADNLSLLTETEQVVTAFNAVVGGMTVEWEGKQVPFGFLHPILQGPDRALREQAYRLRETSRARAREAIDALWAQAFTVRKQIARNAGFPSYREYRWQELHRFDYTPDDCKRFHETIESVVVPAAAALYKRGQARLGVPELYPWDLSGLQGLGRVVDPPTFGRLVPFETTAELIAKGKQLFNKVSPVFGHHFETIEQRGLLDLETRANKAQVGYCVALDTTGVPFVFFQSPPTHRSLLGLLHEGGHAFNVMEMRALPYFFQRYIETTPIEFAEVGSTAMELLGAAHFEGTFYNQRDAARALRDNLETIVFFLPYATVVDAFQHWAYENPDAALDPDTCDAAYLELWNRFMCGVNYDPLPGAIAMRRRTQPHIICLPLYFIEYAIAQLGAIQIWANSRTDYAGAVAAYQHALSLGNTRTLPELYRAAGARFAFDREMVSNLLAMVMDTIHELETVTA